MPFDSQGKFTRMHNWEDDRINDIEIITDHHDEEDNNFADALSQAVLKDGRTAMIGNFNMGKFQIKNMMAGTIETDAVTKGQLDLKSDESRVVHLSGDEAISGSKVFAQTPLVPNIDDKEDRGQKVANTKFVQDIADTIKTGQSFSTVGKQNIVNWGMPNYAAGISRGSNMSYTADRDGFLVWQGQIVRSYNVYNLSIDGVEVGSVRNADWTDNAARCVFPIAKGSWYSSSGHNFFAFFPCKGV